MERWKINRAGIVNFWYYNEEEVLNFEDGHLLLRGANGTGKSITMASLIPFLLDGKKSPERFDPSNSRAKTLRDLALGSKELTEHKSRIGYLYLEYAKKKSQQYLTTVIGLQTGLGDKVSFWGFIIQDNRRIGKEICLQRQIGQTLHTIHPDELKKQIGNGGVVVRGTQEYMKYINQELFGLELPVYESFIKLILQLRSPKLNRDCKPSDITRILTQSLPPLTEQELRPVNDVVDSLEKQQTRLNKLKKEHERLSKLCKDYEAYNRHILYKKALGMEGAYKKYTNLLQNEQETQTKLGKVEKTIKQLKQEHQMVMQMLKEAEEESKVLERPDIQQKDEQLQQLNKREESLKSKLQQKEVSLKKHQEQKRMYEQEQRYLLQHLNDVEEHIHRISDNMDQLAKQAYFSGHQILLQADDSSAIEMVLTHANQHREQIVQIKALIDKQEDKLKDYQEVSRELQVEQDQKEKVLDQTQRLEEKLDLEREQWLREIENWTAGNKVLKLDESHLGYLENQIVQYPNNIDKEELLLPFKDLVEKQEQQYHNRLNQVKLQYLDASRDLKMAKNELAQWEQNPDPCPPRYSKQKQEFEGQFILPLFKAIRFKEQVPVVVRLRMEAAMEEMGILDAFLAPDYEQDENMIKQRRLLIPQPTSVQRKTLADFLEPEMDLPSFLTGDYVLQVLKSIAVDQSGLTVVDTTGKYVLGILQGKPLPANCVRYIGKETRQQYWLSVREQLQHQLEEEKESHKALEQERSHIETLLSMLREEYGQIPQVDSVLRVYEDWRTHQQRLEQQQKLVDHINEKVKSYWTTYQALQQNINEMAQDFPDSKRTTFESAYESINEYANVCVRWLGKWSDKQQYHGRLSRLKQDVNQVIELCSLLQDEVQQVKDEVSAIVAQQKALNIDLERLGAVELREKINDLNRIKIRCEQKDRQIQRDLGRYENEYEVKIVELKKIEHKRRWSEFLIRNWTQLILHEKQFQSIQLSDTQINDVKKLYAYIVKVMEDAPSPQEWIGEPIYRSQEILHDYQPSGKADFHQLEEPDPSYLEHVQEGYALEWEALQIFKKRKVFELKYNGEWIDPFTLRDYLANDIHMKELYLGEEERKLLEDAILNNLGYTLRKRIRDAENWKKHMNTLMKSISLHNGLKLELRWIPNLAETETEMDTSELVKLLYADVQTRKESDQQLLRQHFRVQIDRAKAQYVKDTAGKHLADYIGELFDYRQWYTFELRFKKENESWKELTHHRFDRLSTGERASATYIPLLAAVHARLQDAKLDSPRLVIMDEVFASIDDENIRQLFGYLDKLDFDYIVNSQYLWGDYDTVKGLSICELMRPKNVPFVTVDRYIWNGKKMTPVDTHPPD